MVYQSLRGGFDMIHYEEGITMPDWRVWAERVIQEITLIVDTQENVYLATPHRKVEDALRAAFDQGYSIGKRTQSWTL